MTTRVSVLRFSLAVLAVCGPLSCLADAGIYTFVDDRGEVFLSNVPDDARYRVLIAPGATPLAPPGEASAAPDFRWPYGAVIERTAGQFGLEAALLHAVISVESAYNPNARSRRGAGGLMQLMPDTAKRYGVADVYDPADNVRGGAQYLADLLKTFGNDLRLALAAYNAGEAAVLKHGKRIPPYPETAAYVPKVLDSYQKYRLSM